MGGSERAARAGGRVGKAFPGLPAAVVLALATAGPAAAAEKAGPLPPDCLAAGVAEQAGALIGRTGDFLAALGVPEGAEAASTALGGRIHDPALAGVDLSAPVRFFYMNPKVFPRPWVYQFGVSDSEALKWAMMKNGGEGDGPLFVRFSGGRATWSLDAAAARDVLGWEQAGGELPEFRVGGRVRARLEVRSILEAYGDEFASGLEGMKERMREALEGKAARPGEAGSAPVGTQLEAAAAALRQVEDVDAGFDITRDAVRAEVDARISPASPLGALLRAQPPGDLGLLGACPADASAAIVHNLSLGNTLRNALWNAAGLAAPGGKAGGTGERAIALFLGATEEGGGGLRTGQRAGILDLRDGEAAEGAREEWDELIPRSGTARGAFYLRPTPPAEGAAGVPGNAAAAKGFRTAELLPNKGVLSAAGIRLFRRFLGERALAAQESPDGLCATAVGSAPEELLREADALLRGGKDSLAASGVFRRSIEALPARPNLLLYVSPAALREWFALSGLSGPSVRGAAEATGLAAGAAVNGEGVRFTLRFPLGALPVPPGQ